VSRGPGHLQNSILHELHQAPGGRLRWRILKKQFPHEVRQKSFYRSIRSLVRMGRITCYEAEYGYGLDGRVRYIALCAVYKVGRHHYFAYQADRQVAALADEAHRQLKAIAAARGFLPEPSHKDASDEVSVDTYRQGTILSD
jgi:hypothetical protein